MPIDIVYPKIPEYPENYQFPVSGAGSEGEELWTTYFPNDLTLDKDFGTHNYHLVEWSTVTTKAFIYQYSNTDIRPNAYMFFPTGNFSVYDGSLYPVYMVAVAKYRPTDNLDYEDHTFRNSVAKYGVAYYTFDGYVGNAAHRLEMGYVPSSMSISSNGIVRFLYNLGQSLLGTANSIFNLLNMRVLGTRFWEVLIMPGFLIFAGFVLLKWVFP